MTTIPRLQAAQAFLSATTSPINHERRAAKIARIYALKAIAKRKRIATDPRVVRIKLAEIERRYTWQRKSRQRGPFHARACVRLRELERVFASRYAQHLRVWLPLIIES
jgi:hypothetical protein